MTVVSTVVKHKPKIKSFAMASVWYGAANILSKASAIIFTPIFTRILSPEEYGVYSLYVSWMSVFTVITTLEIHGSVMYRALSAFENEKEVLISSAVGLQGLMSLLSVFLCILLGKFVKRVTALPLSLIITLIFQIFLNSVTGIYFAKKRYEYSYKIPSYINVITGICVPLISLFLITVLGYTGPARIISQLLISLFFSIPIIFIIFKNGRKLFSGAIWKYLIFSALPLLPNYLAASATLQTEKIVIAHTLGEGTLGKYAIAHSAGFILSLLTNALTLSLSPWIIRTVKDGDNERLGILLSGALRLLSLAAPIFFTLIPEVFLFIAGKNYYTAIGAVYPITISVVFIFLSGLLSNALISVKKGGLVSMFSIISLGLSVPLSIYAMKVFGYNGSGFSTLVCYIFLFFAYCFGCKKYIDKDIFEIKSIFYSFVYLFLFSFLTFSLKNYFISRVLLLVALSMIFVKEILNYKGYIFKKSDVRT